ncbi:MAG: tetratricopeptide repeat protein [Lewinellaceae bacterium]|nr:tetratricopeptide repeat protein [Saprospiraceae bacterium]MCB9337989.1 tetratricopeptide repeat protein [Lewinellaceae bacterium]
MNKQLQVLLSDSLAHYRSRLLKKALNTAQIALEFGQNEGAETQGLVRANLLLARIYNTNGRYQNEPSFFKKALFYLSEAKRLNNVLPDPHANIEIPLIGGKIYISLKDYRKAESCLKDSLALAKSSGDLDNTVISLAMLCQVQIGLNNLDQAEQLAKEGLDILKHRNENRLGSLWSEIYLQLSQVYIKKQDYTRSLEMSQSLLGLSRAAGDIEKEILALRNIAVVCGVKSNYKIGMQFFLEALDKCEAIGYRELFVQIQVNIGTLYAHLYNYDEAINRYRSVLDEHGDLLEDRTKVVIYNNLGNIFISTDQPETALEFFEKANVLAEEFKFEEMIAYTFAQMGRAKFQLHCFSAAIQDTRFAEEHFQRLGDVNGLQINLLNQGNLAFHKKKYDEAIELTLKAVETARTMKDDAAEIRGFKLLSTVFKAKGQFEKALEYQERYAEIQEEYAKVQRNRQFLDMEIRHTIKEKQKEIEQLTNDNEYKALLLQKSDQISRQNEELRQANEELKQFAYIASHDLKEPLRMISSFTQIIQRTTDSYLDDKQREYFSYVTEGVDRMNTLLDGLLKYATIGNHQQEFEQVNLNEVLAICQSNLQVRINETGATLIVDHLPAVKGTSQLLTQLFQNLLTNSLKFKKADVKPVIRVGAAESEDEHIIFVQDNGIGISHQYREKVFEIFHRLHTQAAYEGTGIGLAICQKIVKRLDGRIWVESKEGEGATFYVAFSK